MSLSLQSTSLISPDSSPDFKALQKKVDAKLKKAQKEEKKITPPVSKEAQVDNFDYMVARNILGFYRKYEVAVQVDKNLVKQAALSTDDQINILQDRLQKAIEICPAFKYCIDITIENGTPYLSKKPLNQILEYLKKNQPSTESYLPSYKGSKEWDAGNPQITSLNNLLTFIATEMYPKTSAEHLKDFEIYTAGQSIIDFFYEADGVICRTDEQGKVYVAKLDVTTDPSTKEEKRKEAVIVQSFTFADKQKSLVLSDQALADLKKKVRNSFDRQAISSHQRIRFKDLSKSEQDQLITAEMIKVTPKTNRREAEQSQAAKDAVELLQKENEPIQFSKLERDQLGSVGILENEEVNRIRKNIIEFLAKKTRQQIIKMSQKKEPVFQGIQQTQQNIKKIHTSPTIETINAPNTEKADKNIADILPPPFTSEMIDQLNTTHDFDQLVTNYRDRIKKALLILQKLQIAAEQNKKNTIIEKDRLWRMSSKTTKSKKMESLNQEKETIQSDLKITEQWLKNTKELLEGILDDADFILHNPLAKNLYHY